jgi:hypothetical protein
LERTFPIIKWAPKYNIHMLVSDTIAGVTVALTVLPQALAYATVANLPPIVGFTLVLHHFQNISGINNINLSFSTAYILHSWGHSCTLYLGAPRPSPLVQVLEIRQFPIIELYCAN